MTDNSDRFTVIPGVSDTIDCLKKELAAKNEHIIQLMENALTKDFHYMEKLRVYREALKEIHFEEIQDKECTCETDSEFVCDYHLPPSRVERIALEALDQVEKMP